MAGGLMPAMHAEAPSMWLSWLEISDVDAACERVKANGGALLSEPMDMHTVGRMAMAKDPTGAVFGLITPAT